LFLIKVHGNVACGGHCLDVVCVFVSSNLVRLYEGFEIDKWYANQQWSSHNFILA
jgi:hypothetical protein